jgi:hypothetical protein
MVFSLSSCGAARSSAALSRHRFVPAAALRGGARERIALRTYPQVNRVERDRLLQREAALDARLLKRLELEPLSASRARQRRALEREAERDRARPSSRVCRPIRGTSRRAAAVWRVPQRADPRY